MSYKVWVLNNNAIENVFIFGEKRETAFSDDDLEMMMEFGFDINSPIICDTSPVQIHKDDSIMQIKKKILNEMGRDSGATYHELYMFSYVEKIIDPYSIFYETVAKNTNYLTRNACTQLLHNLIDDFEPLDETVDVFSYKDFSSVVGPYRRQNVPIGLGVLPPVSRNDHLFSANPFYAVEYSARNSVHTDAVLLFNHGTIVDNNIFVCLAGDVFAAFPEQTEFLAKTYYPLLATRSIFETESLLEKRDQLVLETDKIMNPRHFGAYEIVDMFYDIYKNTQNDFEYRVNGVRRFEIAIKPSYSFVMPIETIFKNVHATSKYKFMKLNLGMRRENIFRIYSDKISKTGRKIPALPREKINSLSKNMGKQKQMSVFVEESNLSIDIDSDGTIYISWGTKNKSATQYLNMREIEALLLADVNPLLETINLYLQRSGYEIPMIEAITDPNIEIKSMDYVASIVLKKKLKKGGFQLKQDIGCLYSVFDVVSDFEKGTTAQLRFKRVNNYREMDQQTLLITETFNKKGRESDVLEALIANHGMTVEEAGNRIGQYLKDMEYRKIDGTTIEVVENPGLPIEMKIEQTDDLSGSNKLDFIVENISNLGYIESLSVYFESMMRIMQDMKTPGVSKEHIAQMCKPFKASSHKQDEGEREDMRMTQPAPVAHERVAAFDFSPTSPMPEYEDNAEMSPRAKGNFKNIQDLLEATEDVEGNYKFNSDESSDLDLTGVEVDNEDLDLTGVEVEEGSSDLDLTGVEVEEMYGGAPPLSLPSESSSEENELGVKNKDRAKNTNPFLKELQKKDPAVILQGKDGRSNIYARSCQSYRQPVVLTKAEKERIDRKSPGSYTKAMKYGSTPENEHYYICPRFWCFKNNVSMTEEQVRNGECDKEYLFEFKNKNNPIEHEDAEGNYIKHYPGFIKKPGLKHCMPCCFASAWETWNRGAKGENGTKEWENQNKTIRWDDAGNKYKKIGKGDWVKQDIDGKERIDETGTVWLMDAATGEWRVNPDEREQPRQSDKCLTEMDNANKGNEGNEEATDMSIRNPDTKRVAKGKLAFLQYAVQHFLNVDYTGKVKTVNGTKYLNEGVETYLRYGTEQFDPESETSNSLLGCIADLLGPNSMKVKTGQFGKMLADAVSVDEFVRFGNASFTAIFRPKAIEIGDKMAIIDENGVKSMTINLEDYSDSELYKRMKTVDANDTDALSSFWEMFAAYEMYKLYLSNPEITVDYTYIWDLISRPNPKLFEKGINLVIMELPRNDITDSIDLICPTNTYTKTKFDVDKPTAFLVKSTYQHEPLFEPVYLYNSKTKMQIRTFTKSNAHLRPIVRMLNQTLNNYCKPKQSLPDVYEYKQPILLDELVVILKEVKYTVLKQVLNYQGKAIALLVQGTPTQAQTPILVPCAPSAPLTNMTVAYMDDETLWTNYETTRTELSRLHAASNGKIPCNPMLKMIEGPMIVGLLTWSNQMIPINPPTNDVPGDGLKSMSVNKTIFQTDDALTKTEQGDTAREEIVRNARIESEMYALFRTTVKTLLAKPANYQIRDRLINETMTRKQGIKHIVNELVKLTRKSVTFKTFDKDVLENMGKMDAIEYDCGGKKSAFLKDGCQLILPLNNILVSTRDNRILYFYRIADELLRFKQQSDFILYPKQIMNTGNTEYKVKQDEFIVLESSLSSDYYDNQTELPINKYMSGEIPYEMATAEKMVKESNVVALEIQGPDILNNCEEKRTDLEGQPDKTYWIKDVFKAKRGNQYEIHFKETCSFGPFLKIANELDNMKYDNIDDVRQLVWESYRDLITPEEDERKQRNFDKIISILKDRQGKTGLLAGVNTVEKFEDVVRSDAYFMTTLDLYVLAQKQGLPIILFSNSKEGGVKKSLDDIGFESDNWLILGKRNPRSADNKFYFVRAQKKIDGKKNPNYIPSFSMVYKPFGLSELNDLSDKIQSAFQDKDFKGNMLSIEEFLQ